MPWGYAAAVVGGALISGYASNKAASTQKDAATQAAQTQQDMYNQMNANLQPYMQVGAKAINPMLSSMGYTYDANGNLIANPNSPLNQQFSFNAADLENTPGYQFALKQGLRGVDASAAARGLGVSGADIKGAADYATGLADQTYGNQFSRALQQYQTNYNAAANNAARLAGVVQAGQNSAAGVGSAGLSAAQNAGNFLTSGANAQAAGYMGTANAVNSGISSGINAYQQNQLVNAINNSTSSTG